MRHLVKHKITFSKSRYHQHIEMVEWCQKNLGYGKWLTGTPTTWDGLESLNWSVDSIFGNTTFAFKNPKHFSMFLLKWS